MAEHATPAPLRDLTEDETVFDQVEFSPTFNLGYEYDDNIFATEDGELSDRVLLATLAARLATQWERHALQAGAGTTLARYADYGSEDTTDYWTSLSGRYDLSESGNLFGGFSYARNHEARGSIDSVSGDEPTIYYKQGVNAGIRQSAGNYAVTLAGSLTSYDYRNTPAGLVEIFNNDRDRDESSLGVRVNYAHTEQWSFFTQLRTDVREYDLTFDDALYERSSSGYRFGVGGRADFGKALKAELMLGYLTQNYDDARFDTVREPDYQGSLDWFISDDSHLRLALAHSLEETTLPGSPGYLYRQISAQWRQRYTDVVFGTFSASYGQADYQQSAITDDYYDIGVGVTRAFTRSIMGSLDARRLQRDSNETGFDFARHQLRVSVGGRF